MGTVVRILGFLTVAVTLMAAVACDEEENATSPTPTPEALRDVMINLTVGEDDPHRATLALLFADSAIKTGHDVTVFLNVDAVSLATVDLPESVRFSQFPPVRDMMADIINQGADVIVCPVCMNEAGISADQLVEGAVIATPGELFPRLDAGAAVISY